MKNYYTFKSRLIGLCALLFICFQTNVYGQITINATGGAPFGSYTTISDAFTAINAGTHTDNILISVNGNTTEPAAPAYLAASGQGAASYTAIGIKPTVVATISGATTPGSAVINMDGADNVTIDGSITVGGTTRDLVIQNTAANTVANVACIRLVGRTTLGLGATNITIQNCNITGNTTGNNGYSGSTVTSTYGIYAGSTTLTTMAATTGGADYDNLIIQNNLVTNAYIGINVIGLIAPSQADNLQIIGNTVGSAINRIGFKGIVGQHCVNGNVTNNTVTEIEATTSISVAGIDFSGSASSGVQIRRNTISNIHSYSTLGYGAYGINITSGINYLISNNVIHGVQTLNYSNSATFNAFGIRIAGGTGHQIYYNSVNMYGAYTTGSTTNAFSAALVVTTTGATGLDIRNNVFANKMTSAVTNVEFMAMSFPTAYNFLNANLERNAYFVTADAQHHVGKIGTGVGTLQYTDLNSWRTISQVNNATNDVNSQPGSGNSNAPFTADNDLTIPALTVTVMESTALPVAVLGLPNVDRTNLNRPAFGGANPDMGAYEFDGSAPSDLVPPVVSGVAAAPGTSCNNVAHIVTATASDNVGVTSVTLSYSYDGVPQTPITMILASGNSLNGTYTGTIPAAAGPNVNVTYSVLALDAGANSSGAVSGASYADNYLVVTASADQAINTGVGTSISATTNDPSFRRLLISEVVQFKTGTGQGTYPAYIPVADNDYVEISNFGDVPADASGYTLSIYGGVNGTYTIPGNTIIPSGSTLVLAFSGIAVDAANLYYGMGLGTASSGLACGYVLESPQGTIADAVATNSYVFTGASGVTGADWSGNIASSSGLAGVRRTVATDNNNATDWTVSSAINVMTIGVYNSEIAIVPIPQTITWTNDFGPTTSTNNPLTVAPFASPGVYTFTATFNDGTCTSTDNVVITVTTPVAPVASFSATPVSGTAPLNVAFTDLSTNLPDTWAWIVSPMTGVTYTTGSASSQNPVMQFANAGMYTITLTASNSAGSDDSTIVQYINVNWCASAANNTADTDIGNVTFGSLNNGSATPVFSNPGATATYTDFTALPVQMYGLGQTYPISVSQITSGTTFYSAYANVFIDYNNDGFFDPTTERVFNGPTSSTGPVSTVSGNVTIPGTATTAIVRMRVVLQEGGNATSPPCGAYGYGETEDYLIEIKCSSVAPTAATDVICNGETSILTASGNSVQWYADAVTSTVLSSGSVYTTPALSTTTSYYASATDVGCLESPRTQFTVTVNQPTSATQTVAQCGNYVWPIDGMTYTATGMYAGTILNSVGCDSVITLDLTILGAVTATDVISSCTPIVWIDGMTYASNNNTAMYTLTTGGGCDSIVTLDLTILSATSATQTITECTSYVWPVDGMTYAATGMYTATVMNSVGCDSVITLDLTINVPTSSTATASACGSYTWGANSTTYAASGVYTATLVNAAGCDSIATLNLTINAATSSTTTETACGSYTWGANSTNYTASGTYTATLVNAAGCDSIATLVLTINSVSDLGVTLTGVTLSADLAGASYQWINCATTSAIAGATSQTYAPTANGSYAVEITENGCVDTSSCVTVGNIGIDTYTLTTVSIVPNPTQDRVTVTFEGSQATVSIIDVNGKLLTTLTVSSGDQVDLSKYEPGVYLFNVSSDSLKAIERVVKY